MVRVVAVEDNAIVKLYRIYGPDGFDMGMDFMGQNKDGSISKEFSELLGVELLPIAGDYFVNFHGFAEVLAQESVDKGEALSDEQKRFVVESRNFESELYEKMGEDTPELKAFAVLRKAERDRRASMSERERAISDWKLIYEEGFMDAEDRFHRTGRDPLVERWLKMYDYYLDAMVVASECGGYYMPLVARGALLSDVGIVRRSAQGLDRRARFRMATGNLRGAMRDLLAIHKLGRMLRRVKKGRLIFLLVGISVEAMGLDSMERLVREEGFTVEMGEQMLAEIESRGEAMKYMDVMDGVERLYLLDLMQKICLGEVEKNSSLYSGVEDIYDGSGFTFSGVGCECGAASYE